MIPVVESNVIPVGKVSDIERTFVPVPKEAENAEDVLAIP